MRFLLVCTVLLISAGSLAQNRRFSANVNYGFIIPHRPALQYLVQGHMSGFELTYENRFYKKPWHINYRYPYWGISALYTDLGNPTDLGKAYALTPFVNLPLSDDPDGNLSMRMGVGMAYISKDYHRLENHKNIAIGSFINASLFCGIEYRVPFSRRLGLKSGIQIHHFSNGSFQPPNLGINIPNVYMGFYYRNGEQMVYAEKTPFDRANRDTHYILSMRIGVKEMVFSQNRKYPIYTLHFTRLRKLSEKFGYTLFADWMYNLALKSELNFDDVVLKNDLSYGQVGLGAGIENFLGTFAGYFQMGAYLYNPNRKEGRFYHRLGIKKEVTRRWTVTLGIKSHFAKADYLELGGGIRL